MGNAAQKDYAARWEAAGIEDDFIFGRVMELHPTLCRELIQAVLPQLCVGGLKIPERQKEIRAAREARGIRLDVYSEDEAHAYEIELQMRDPKNLPKRARYYGAMIDLQLLDRGERYDTLKDVIVIFICPVDIFGQRRRKYTFQNTCEENPGLRLNDGITRIFLNAGGTRGKADPKLQALFDLMLGKETRNAFGRRLYDAVTEIKKDRALRRQYMTLKMRLDEERAEGREEGREEGRTEGEDRLARLITLLNESGRSDDIRTIAADREARRALYAEYHI